MEFKFLGESFGGLCREHIRYVVSLMVCNRCEGLGLRRVRERLGMSSVFSLYSCHQQKLVLTVL